MIFVILLFVAILYISLVISVKLNIMLYETVISVKINVFKFYKNFVFRFNYLDLIKRIFNKEKNKKKLLKININNWIKPFFVKDIDIYSELFEEKISIAVKFSVISIIRKKFS